MKRLILLVAAIISLASITISPVFAASLQNFTITSFTSDYYISRDNEGRSRMTVREEIVAEFPHYDQNHGLERAIPQKYDGHSVSLKIKSVQKSDGSPWNYSTYTSNDNLVVRIGDADRYVHGKQTYVITYEQRDVTRYFADTKSDELYWDTNGTEWQVPIAAFSATFHIDQGLENKLSDKAACYKGAAGASSQCEITRNGSEYKVAASHLAPGQNVTVAIGFQPATFGAYKQSPLDAITSLIATIAAAVSFVWSVLFVVAFGLGVWVVLWYQRLSRRTKEIGTIVPEYIPPSDVSVTASASLVPGQRAAFAAQLIDLAVRHYVKIYEIDKKWIFGSKDYEIEIVKDISSLKPEEQELLHDIFSGATTIGSRLTMSSLKNNSSVAMSMLDNDPKLQKLMRGQYGLQARNEVESSKFKKASLVFLIIGVLTLQPGILVVAGITFGLSYALYPLTDKGLDLYRYLEGLKLYIKVAEAERLKMLQSPEGAQKIGAVDPNNSKQMVVLYERVLPYAVLFGQEKQWNAQLGKYYESLNSQPDWYVSNTVLTAASFGNAMSSFTSASSYTSASSSSSGGSSGGGSSGGGGGGGGGGGW